MGAIYLCSKNSCNSTQTLKWSILWWVSTLLLWQKHFLTQYVLYRSFMMAKSKPTGKSTWVTMWHKTLFHISLSGLPQFNCMNEILDMFSILNYSETQGSERQEHKVPNLPHSIQKNKQFSSHAEMWELVTNMHFSLSRSLRTSDQLLKAAEIKGNCFTSTSGIFLTVLHPCISGSCQLLYHRSHTWKCDTGLTPIMEQMEKEP